MSKSQNMHLRLQPKRPILSRVFAHFDVFKLSDYGANG